MKPRGRMYYVIYIKHNIGTNEYTYIYIYICMVYFTYQYIITISTTHVCVLVTCPLCIFHTYFPIFFHAHKSREHLCVYIYIYYCVYIDTIASSIELRGVTFRRTDKRTVPVASLRTIPPYIPTA